MLRSLKSVINHEGGEVCHYHFLKMIIWAATWQNQQNGCASSEDSDQPGHPTSLIRVFAVRMKKKAWGLSYPLSAQRWLWSDWADAKAGLSLRWAHTHFVGFVMSWLIWTVLLQIQQEVRTSHAQRSTESSWWHRLRWRTIMTLLTCLGVKIKMFYLAQTELS